jgi:hypothetical protein
VIEQTHTFASNAGLFHHHVHLLRYTSAVHAALL